MADFIILLKNRSPIRWVYSETGEMPSILVDRDFIGSHKKESIHIEKGMGRFMELKTFIAFLNQLEENNIFYKLDKIRKEAIMVEVAVPGQRWEIEFLEDGTVDIEKFIGDKDLYDANELETLFETFSE